VVGHRFLNGSLVADAIRSVVGRDQRQVKWASNNKPAEPKLRCQSGDTC
jgi:hypothetical protein